jgi:NADPH:quinone reductase-like Zn-dependent oxidoreductase
MRAAVLREYGTPLCGEFAEPVASDDQVVVEVGAAGVNPFDVLLGSGTFVAKPALPYVVGLDGVGRLPDGRQVYFESTVAPFGAAAERALVDRSGVVELPPGLDVAIGAALGNAGLAAWLSLTWRGELVPGETVLVLGATGTVGSIAVQLAKLLGAGRIIAAGRDPDRLRRAFELGADECVRLGAGDAGDRLAEAVGPGADLIIDLTWGVPAKLAVSAAATGARLVQVGNGAEAEAAVPADIVRSRALSILGYATYHVPRDKRLDAYRHLADLAAAGQIRVELERVPLDDVELAWERQRSGALCKQILIPGRADHQPPPPAAS